MGIDQNCVELTIHVPDQEPVRIRMNGTGRIKIERKTHGPRGETTFYEIYATKVSLTLNKVGAAVGRFVRTIHSNNTRS